MVILKRTSILKTCFVYFVEMIKIENLQARILFFKCHIYFIPDLEIEFHKC